MRSIAAILTACAAFVLQAGFSGVYAANASGECSGPAKTNFLSSDGFDQTLSTVWNDITDGRLNFTTAATGCVIVTFSALGSTTSNGGFNLLHVRTLLDVNSLCMPANANDVFLSASPPGISSNNSIVRVCKNIAAGSHSVRVQYRSGDGDLVAIGSHVLTVMHN